MCVCTNTRCVKYARLLFLFSLCDVWIYSTNKNLTDSSSALRQYMILCYKKLCWVSESVCVFLCWCVKISRTVFLNSAPVARKNRNQTRSTHARDRRGLMDLVKIQTFRPSHPNPTYFLISSFPFILLSVCVCVTEVVVIWLFFCFL